MSEQQPSTEDDRTLSEIWRQQTRDDPLNQKLLDGFWEQVLQGDPSVWCDPNIPLSQYLCLVRPSSPASDRDVQNFHNPISAPLTDGNEEAVLQLQAMTPSLDVIRPTPAYRVLDWTDPVPSTAEPKFSSLSPVDFSGITNMATPSQIPVRTPESSPAPLPVATQPMKFVPRPSNEYQALISGLAGGIQTHQNQGQRPDKDLNIPFQQAVSNAVDDHATRAKRKRVDESSIPTVPAKKRVRVNGADVAVSPLISVGDQAHDVYGPKDPVDGVISHPTTASDVIGKNCDNRKAVYTPPWGLQRILTQKFLECRCEQLGIPVPPVTDQDVRMYCSNGGKTDEIHSRVPPESVDIRLLGNMELSAEEILTFFPHHLKWHDAIFRLVQNGWSSHDMARYINHARGLIEHDDAKRGNTVLKWVQSANNAIIGQKCGFKDRKPWKTTCFTAKGWVPWQDHTAARMTDYFLVDLSDGVVNLPVGDGERLLTRAIRLALIHGHHDIKLSQVHHYIRANLLMVPRLPSMVDQMTNGRHPDVAAIDRAKQMFLDLKYTRRT